MTVVMVAMLGLAAGAVTALVAFVAALVMGPAHKARRVALAAALGGTIAFTLTALVQLPFFTDGAVTVPLLMACAAGAAGAGLCATMIWRARPLHGDP